MSQNITNLPPKLQAPTTLSAVAPSCNWPPLFLRSSGFGNMTSKTLPTQVVASQKWASTVLSVLNIYQLSNWAGAFCLQAVLANLPTRLGKERKYLASRGKKTPLCLQTTGNVLAPWLSFLCFHSIRLDGGVCTGWGVHHRVLLGVHILTLPLHAALHMRQWSVTSMSALPVVNLIFTAQEVESLKVRILRTSVLGSLF